MAPAIMLLRIVIRINIVRCISVNKIEITVLSARVLDALSGRGLKAKTVHEFERYGTRRIVKHCLGKGQILYSKETVQNFVWQERAKQESGTLPHYQWGITRRAAVYLDQMAEYGKIQDEPIRPWEAEHNPLFQAISCNPSNSMKVIDIICRTRDAVMQLELSDTHKTPAEMAADYHFTTRQNNYLQLLQDPQYEELWAELLGGFAQGGGELMNPDSTRTPTGTLQWPLPVAGTITSQFGYRVDPITGEVSSHTGTDIACAEGTPILAAADGTVTVANGLDSWGGSYGYYIQVDHSSGLETLYAHCSSICVTTGQQVQAGQVIGYVGHTGRVTGNHLHLEVRIGGNRVDAMQYFAL